LRLQRYAKLLAVSGGSVVLLGLLTLEVFDGGIGGCRVDRGVGWSMIARVSVDFENARGGLCGLTATTQ